MIEKLKKKLNSRSGETLSETLIALLISALALVMLAGAITAAMGSITRSRVKMKDYYDKSEAAITGGASTGSATIADGAGAGLTSKSYTITYYENSEFGSIPVISYTY
ncbi:MAG: hypothetical protein IJU77_04525 [Butyrivibrio sp.]|nr:hypothetical protein [Butyrivibrio sp.]